MTVAKMYTNSHRDSCELIDLFESNYCFEINHEKTEFAIFKTPSIHPSSPLISNIANVHCVLECLKIGFIGSIVQERQLIIRKTSH